MELHTPRARAAKVSNRQSSIAALSANILLCLLLVGCGKIVNTALSKGKYQPPTSPRAALAVIEIDSDSGWLQRIEQFAVRIDGQLALEKKLDSDRNEPIKDILVSPGKHDLSVGIIYQSFSDAMPSTYQEWTTFSADVKAGHKYFLQGELSSGVDGKLSFDGRLVETNAGKVVEESENLMAPKSDL